MSKDILAGYPTQIRKLRKRLKQLNMEDTDPQDIKSTIDSLNELTKLYKEEVTNREDRRKAREEKLLEKESDEEALPPTPEVPTDAVPAEEPVEEELTDKPKSSESVPNSYFIEHLVEGLTASDNPAMQALGYDCLKEIIEVLDDEARHAIYEKWENYFNNDPEFKEAMSGNMSPRLQEQHQEMQQYMASQEAKPTDTLINDPVEGLPVDEPLPEEPVVEVESAVSKYALDDQVEPTRGTPGSKGRVMRYDDDSDMAYIHWDEGTMAEKDGFGTYKGSDLKNLTRNAEFREISPEKCKCGHTKFEHSSEDKPEGPYTKCDDCDCKGFEKTASTKSELTHSDECAKCGTDKRYPGQCRTCKKNKELGTYRKDASEKKAELKLTDEERGAVFTVEGTDPKEAQKFYISLMENGTFVPEEIMMYGDSKTIRVEVSNNVERNRRVLEEAIQYANAIARSKSRSAGTLKLIVKKKAEFFPGEKKDREDREKRFQEKKKKVHPKTPTKSPMDLAKDDADDAYAERRMREDYGNDERLSALDSKADGEGLGYGGNSPGMAYAPKRDKDVSLNADDEIDEDDSIGSSSWMHKVIEEMQLYYQKVNLVPDFDDQINYVMDIANDEAGQLITTPEQVEKWFEEYHYESEKTADGDDNLELNVANLKWIAKKSQTRNGVGWAIFSTQPVNFQGKEVPAGTQVMVIKDNSEKGLSQPELEQAFFDNFGKDLARISLKVDLAILKKGSEVKPLAYDARRRELKFIAVDNNKISGWTSVDKFDFQMKTADVLEKDDYMHKVRKNNIDPEQLAERVKQFLGRVEQEKERGSNSFSAFVGNDEFSQHVARELERSGLSVEVTDAEGARGRYAGHNLIVSWDTANPEQNPTAKLEGSKVEGKFLKIKSIKILEDLARDCPDCFEKFVKFAEQKGMKIKADDVDDVITNIREKIKTTKERLETTTEPIETESKKEVKAQDPNSPPADDPGEGYKWFWNEKTMAWEKMQENAGGGGMSAPSGGGFAGGVTY